MVCPNCGAILVEGQLICSNCDREIISNDLASNNSYELNNVDYNSSSKLENVTNDSLESNNELSNEINNYNEYDNFNKAESKNSKFNFLLVFIIIIIILGGAYFVLRNIPRKTSGNNVDTNSNLFIEQYNTIVEDIKIGISFNQDLTCDVNCHDIIDFDDAMYDLTIIDSDIYYKVILQTKEKEKLNDSDCSSLQDAYCENDKIVGRVYKDDNK